MLLNDQKLASQNSILFAALINKAQTQHFLVKTFCHRGNVSFSSHVNYFFLYNEFSFFFYGGRGHFLREARWSRGLDLGLAVKSREKGEAVLFPVVPNEVRKGIRS